MNYGIFFVCVSEAQSSESPGGTGGQQPTCPNVTGGEIMDCHASIKCIVQNCFLPRMPYLMPHFWGWNQTHSYDELMFSFCTDWFLKKNVLIKEFNKNLSTLLFITLFFKILLKMTINVNILTWIFSNKHYFLFILIYFTILMKTDYFYKTQKSLFFSTDFDFETVQSTLF